MDLTILHDANNYWIWKGIYFQIYYIKSLKAYKIVSYCPDLMNNTQSIVNTKRKVPSLQPLAPFLRAELPPDPEPAPAVLLQPALVRSPLQLNRKSMKVG